MLSGNLPTSKYKYLYSGELRENSNCSLNNRSSCVVVEVVAVEENTSSTSRNLDQFVALVYVQHNESLEKTYHYVKRKHRKHWLPEQVLDRPKLPYVSVSPGMSGALIACVRYKTISFGTLSIFRRSD